MKTSPRAPRPWHHGNLLPSLVEAADAITREQGAQAVSFRTVAAGVLKGNRPVSHTAAMAHVGSITELLAHVALGGWRELADELARVSPEAPGDERLVQLGLTYRRFAVGNTHRFRLMYDERIWKAIVALGSSGRADLERTPPDGFKKADVLIGIECARNDGFAEFVGAVQVGRQDGGLRLDQPIEPQTRLIASLAHGLSMEALDEQLPEGEAEPLLRLAVDGLRRLG